MPSNVIIALVVLRDLDLHFQCQHFLNVNISETMRASVKMRAMTLLMIGILDQKSSLRMLYSVTL